MKRHAARPLAHAITQRTLVFRTKYAGQRLLSDRSGPQTTGPNEMETQPLPEPDDPRPSWLFASSSFLRVLLIPIGLGYAVFYHDFGEREHVFMPPRRWVQRQKEAFFTLSPAEQQLASQTATNIAKDTRQ